MGSHLVTMERKAVDPSGRLGSLYDASCDRIIQESLINCCGNPEFNPECKCNVFSGAKTDFMELFKAIKFDDALIQSILLGTMHRSGISSFLNFKESINKNTRFLYYLYQDKHEQLDITNKNVDKIISLQTNRTTVTHMITKIIWGFEFLCVIPNGDEDSARATEKLLRNISDRLQDTDESLRLTNEEIGQIKKLPNITVFGSKTCIDSPNTSLVIILNKIKDWQNDPDMHVPIFYTLYPLQQLYNGPQISKIRHLTDADVTHITNIEMTIIGLDDYFNNLKQEYRKFPRTIPSSTIDEPPKDMQVQLSKLLYIYEEFRAKVGKMLIEVRRDKCKPIEITKLISHHHYTLLRNPALDVFRNEVQQWLDKAYLRERLEKDQIIYVKVSDMLPYASTLVTYQEINTMIIECYSNQHKSRILWYSSDWLKRKQLDEWEDIYHKLITERTEKINLVYVDFSQCLQKLEEFAIRRLSAQSTSKSRQNHSRSPSPPSSARKRRPTPPSTSKKRPPSPSTPTRKRSPLPPPPPKKRSPSPPPSRKQLPAPPSSTTRRSPTSSPARKRSPSPTPPPRKRSPSPPPSRKQLPAPHSPKTRRSPTSSPARKRSPSPTPPPRKRSPSPPPSRKQLPAPHSPKTRRSPTSSPARKRSPSPTPPPRKRSPSPPLSRKESPAPHSPKTRRSPTSSPARKRSPSPPPPPRKQSPAPPSSSTRRSPPSSPARKRSPSPPPPPREQSPVPPSPTTRRSPTSSLARKRSPSPPPSRKQLPAPPSPTTRRSPTSSPARKRSPSPPPPPRKRSPLPLPSRKQSPVPPSPTTRRSPTSSPARKRSPSPPPPPRKRSPSPPLSRKESPAPHSPKTRRSPTSSPARKRSPSPPPPPRKQSPAPPSSSTRRSPPSSPARKRSPSPPPPPREQSPVPPSPTTRRSPTSSLARKRSPSPPPSRKQLPAPPSPTTRRSPTSSPARKRSPSPPPPPRKRSPLPLPSRKQSPVPPSPTTRRSPTSSPARKRSPSPPPPPRKRSPLPLPSRKQSPVPPSPTTGRSPTSSPARKRSPSPPPPPRKRSPLPLPSRKQSPVPPSPTTGRSPTSSPARKRSPSPSSARKRSPSPASAEKRLSSPSSLTTRKLTTPPRPKRTPSPSSPVKARSSSPDSRTIGKTSSSSPTARRSPSSIMEINVLLLGETGVGKSTFINAFLNYLLFDTLQKAEQDDPAVLIPVSFLTTVGHQFDEVMVKFGDVDPNENFEHEGQSVTQQCQSYVFHLNDNLVLRLIDTPGMGDTRGLTQDDKNINHILTYVNNLSHINAICLLLKPNASRLNIFFRSCIQQLFTYLTPLSYPNIIFCFINARSTFYAPGDTGPLLRKMLKQEDLDAIPFEKYNTFCFDSESFRYLAARKCGVEFDDFQKEECTNSWTTSVHESVRLLHFILKRKPYNVDESQSPRKAALEISMLTRPLMETLRSIIYNWKLRETGCTDKQMTLISNPINKQLCSHCAKTNIVQVEPFWIVEYQPVKNKRVNHCECPFDESHFLIESIIEHGIDSQRLDLESNEFQGHLYEVLFQCDTLLYYLKQKGLINENDDPFGPVLERFLKEEQLISEHKEDDMTMNMRVAKTLGDMKKIRQKNKQQLKTSDENLSHESIYQIIDQLKRLPTIEQQLESIKTSRKLKMEANEHSVELPRNKNKLFSQLMDSLD